MEVGVKNKVVFGFMWKFLERIFAQGVSFIVSIVLARLLLPEEYGVVTLVLVFITIANVFVSSGFGDALIQKKDSNDVDFSTVFYCSMLISIIIYLMIFFLSDCVARFYNNPVITPVLRVMGLKIPISSFSTIQHAYVSKHMEFKKFFFSTLGGTIASGIVGIILALNGFGVWALVIQYLTNTLIDTVVLFFTISWRPRAVFSYKSASSLIKNAWKFTFSSLINTVYGQIYNLVIGKVYSTDQLAYYNKGNQFPSLIITNIDVSIASVMFPAMANCNDSYSQLKKLCQKSIRLSCYCIFPLLIGLSAVSNILIKLLLTSKWMDASFFLVVGCVVFMFQPLQTSNWQVLKAAGKSEWCLKLEVLKKAIGCAILAASIPFGIKVVALSAILNAFISTLINMIYCNKVVHYSIFEQLKDFSLSLFYALLMGVAVYLVGQIAISDILKLFLQILVGMTIYLGISIITKNDNLLYLIGFARNIFRRTP